MNEYLCVQITCGIVKYLLYLLYLLTVLMYKHIMEYYRNIVYRTSKFSFHSNRGRIRIVIVVLCIIILTHWK